MAPRKASLYARSFYLFKIVLLVEILILMVLVQCLHVKKSKFLNVYLENNSWIEGLNFFQHIWTKSISEEDLKISLLKNCNQTFNYTVRTLGKLDENGSSSILEYKKHLASEFVKKYANPRKKSNRRLILPMFDYTIRPNPKKGIKNINLFVDYQEVDDDILKDKKRRMKLGDDDILKIPEVQAELNQTEYEVPNLIHYIWFDCHPFTVDNFITVFGMLNFHLPRLILFHTNCEPTGVYWDIFKLQSGKRLKIVKRTPPKSMWGIKMKVIQHKSDTARLQILLEVGGIYLDCDSTVLRPLDELRKYKMVMGEESSHTLASNILFANRTSWFLRRWYLEFKYFEDRKWCVSACQVPWSLWRIYPNSVHVIKRNIGRPNWDELHYLYTHLLDWRQIYVMHMSVRVKRDLGEKTDRPLKQLAVLNTTYGEIARHAIWGDKRIRDVTNWDVTCNLPNVLVP